jgi:uracil-DNA glycosylase
MLVAAGRSIAVTLLPEWEDLHQDVVHCTRCPLSRTRTRAVPGDGLQTSRLMFVGEAPGAQEDARGRPFVGPAGRLLSELLEAVGIPREAVYITNILKCRPPENRAPADYEIERCMPYLRRQAALIRPHVICALGSFALKSLVDSSQGISMVHGQFFQKGRFSFFATYHPAAALYHEALKDVMVRDFDVLGKKWRSINGNHDHS